MDNDKDLLKSIITKKYGIRTMSELDEAIKNLGKLDLALFVNPIKKEIKQAG